MISDEPQQRDGNITVKEGGPSTAAVELGIALVEGCPTTRAPVDALALVLLVLTCPCRLSPLLTKDPKLLRIRINARHDHGGYVPAGD